MKYQAIRSYPNMVFGSVVDTFEEALDDLLRITNNHTSNGNIDEVYKDYEIKERKELEGTVW
jgi:hypothetical protein